MYIKENDQLITESLIDFAFVSLKTYKSIKELQDQHAGSRIYDSPDESLAITQFEKLNSITSRIKVSDDYIVIKGIDFQKFLQRIKVYYSENNFSKIFMKEYTKHAQKLWEKKKITRKEMKIKYLQFPTFFALEIAMIFEDLGYEYNVKHYLKIARFIRSKTWLKNLHLPVKEVPINISNLKNIRYTLKPYQKDFIEMYPTLKERYNLNGYLLSFDQGLGKTLTAISLAECLDKDQVVIVCPNSLKENWAYEIKEYFYKYEDEKLWRDEVYVHGSKKYSFTKKTKYIIVNLEAIPAAYDLISNRKDSILIVDEMHNVRNMKGKRTLELSDLKSKLGKTDVLLMSGTPIKALPNEIIPSLMLIDPLFTEEVAKLYFNCFNVDGTATKEIVNARFGMVIHRKTKKEVLTLPDKHIHELNFTVPNSNKYLSDVVSKEVEEVFSRLYNAELERSDELRNNYINMIEKYSKAPYKDKKEYLKYLKNPEYDYHESERERFDGFTKKYVIPNIYYPVDLKNFKEAETAYVRMKERAMGKALGQIIHPRRKELYIQLYENNKEEIIDMIHNATKKTVIFSRYWKC